MRLIEAQARLLAMGQPAFTTADASACLGISRAHASKVLERLSRAGEIVRLRHGLWGARDRIQVLALPQYLAAPFPSYVSLQSALYYHGMISQVPSVTYAVSVARTRRFETPLGAVSIHHVDPAFFFGYERVGEDGANMAVPEKSLLDVLYLSPAKTRLFRVLPELELPRTFSIREARGMIRRIRSAQRGTLVEKRFEEIMSGQARKS
ncbi:MAG: type IV toxin-antitoxin system AbiEi family antitoxin domain-containing protein [Phycisphaerae bacterium]|nr:type IV toxin-antitoxin system AbiEi family antitoxin domain-containing protein [Phycisphaerae bacterium]